MIVRRDFRYVRTSEIQEFLDRVLETAAGRRVTLKEGSIFWRAQLGHDWREHRQGEEVFEVECALPSDRMKPLRNRALEGRVNPKGIPYLYLSTTKESAMSEVRPWIGSYVSVGQFELLKNLEIIDCSRDHAGLHIYFEEPSPEEIEKAVWSAIDRAFAKPMTRSDDSADYASTQIIAELFKNGGFGGIAYKSNFGKNGFNIALFDIDAADLINCSLYQVASVDMEFSEQDNPYFVTKHLEKKSRRRRTEAKQRHKSRTVRHSKSGAESGTI
jgi:hypothetical protein